MMSVDVLNVAVVTPPVVESEGVPSVVDPSLNVTVPVGLPLPGEVTDTVAVNVTDCPKLGGLTKTGGIDRTGQRRRSVLDDHQRARGACCSRLTTAALTRRNRKWVRSGGRRRSGRDCQASGSSRTS